MTPASKAGACAALVNQAGGISFEIDDPENLQEEAEEKAIEDARENGERLARALSVRLGRVKAFTVSSGTPGPEPLFAARLAEEHAAPVGGPPVPAGAQDVVTTVSITYELR